MERLRKFDEAGLGSLVVEAAQDRASAVPSGPISRLVGELLSAGMPYDEVVRAVAAAVLGFLVWV